MDSNSQPEGEGTSSATDQAAIAGYALGVMQRVTDGADTKAKIDQGVLFLAGAIHDACKGGDAMSERVSWMGYVPAQLANALRTMEFVERRKAEMDAAVVAATGGPVPSESMPPPASVTPVAVAVAVAVTPPPT